MEKLTVKQNLVLDYLKRSIAKNGYPPTVREIGKALNLSSPATVQAHLNTLEAKGYIKRGDSKNRAIELLIDNDYIESNTVDVPLLGKVTAGNPIEAIEMPDEFFTLPASMIPTKKEIFTLRVSGTSMINAGVHDGDIVIVQRQATANNGDMVVAMTEDNEVTLKTFYKEDGYFRLQPENDTMAPIILDKVYIVGKAIGLYRKF
ncbi:MAG: transcriptional repressor LexA [Bacilli bacterium]|jgi:repressor LexA|nr:transcriptional repressor LexA [Bacilli bacterium]